jgi:hypothetical protein
MQPMDIKVPWIYTLICKFTSVSQACTGLYHYHNQHPVAFCLCCCLYCLLCSRCDRQKCHHLLNLEYDSSDILVCTRAVHKETELFFSIYCFTYNLNKRVSFKVLPSTLDTPLPTFFSSPGTCFVG